MTRVSMAKGAMPVFSLQDPRTLPERSGIYIPEQGTYIVRWFCESIHTVTVTGSSSFEIENGNWKKAELSEDLENIVRQSEAWIQENPHPSALRSELSAKMMRYATDLQTALEQGHDGEAREKLVPLLCMLAFIEEAIK